MIGGDKINKSKLARKYNFCWRTIDRRLNPDKQNKKERIYISKLDKYIKSQEENFIIGGATIYKLLMPYANKMYITEINKEFDGDVTFPEINMEEWKITDKEKGLKNEENPYDYSYVTYIRK